MSAWVVRWLLLCGLLMLGCAREHRVPPFAVVAEGGMDARAGEDASREPDAEQTTPRLARNIILFMGDGMGPEQLAAGRALRSRLRIDAMNGPGFANTDSTTTLRVGGNNPPATDSAAAATAIATGVVVENGRVSIGADGGPLETVLERCKQEGKATGLVTNANFFDASAAAFASHQVGRGRYSDIARDMLGTAQPEVVMGSGAWLVDDGNLGLQPLITAGAYEVVRDRGALDAWVPTAQARLLGLFATDFVSAVRASEPYLMTPALERSEASPDPTLATMTQRAIERLALDDDGFFLFVEDENLDVMGHRGPAEVAWANRAYPAQVVALDDAVGVAIDWVLRNSSFDETLIVVTADHETGGYRFDHALGPDSGEFLAAGDGDGFRYGFHTRTPVAVYALGPGSVAVNDMVALADVHRMLTRMFP